MLFPCPILIAGMLLAGALELLFLVAGKIAGSVGNFGSEAAAVPAAPAGGTHAFFFDSPQAICDRAAAQTPQLLFLEIETRCPKSTICYF